MINFDYIFRYDQANLIDVENQEQATTAMKNDSSDIEPFTSLVSKGNV